MTSLTLPAADYPPTGSKKRTPYHPPATPTYPIESTHGDSETTIMLQRSSGTGSDSYFAGPMLSSPTAHIRRPSTSFSVLTRLTRGRLHPFTLLPAFLLGVLAVVTFGNGQGKDLHVEVSGVGSFSWGKSVTSETGMGTGMGTEQYVQDDSGHLFWNGKGKHPIFGLMANASQAWDLKVRRQSKTLDQAVREYIRRHGRRPPKGYAEWFNYAKQHNVVLIDEYSQIIRDVHPFLAISPQLLRSKSQEVQNEPYTFTLAIPEDKKQEIDITGNRKDLARAKDVKDLLKRWYKFVPGAVNLTLTEHDGPSVQLDWGLKERLSKAAKEGKVLTEEEVNRVDDDPTQWGFNIACPPDSRLRRAYDGLEVVDMRPTGQSFVSDQLMAMDLCQNPEWQQLHGFTSWKGFPPGQPRPLLTMSKMSLHSDILVPPLEQYRDISRVDPPWEEKKNNQSFVWRGSTTGVWFNRETRWRSSQRMRLYWLDYDDHLRPVTFLDEYGQVRREVLVTKELMKRYGDFGFGGRMGQCDPDGTCEVVAKLIQWKDSMIWDDQNEYKFQLDVDGNAWSGRFHRLLSSNSAVLKSTIFPEWYSERIQPWLHFIPVKVDYSDLFDIMAFFTGDMNGIGAQDELAKRIADEGKKWALAHWRWEDMETYFFLLTLEWARAMADDRSAFDFKG